MSRSLAELHTRRDICLMCIAILDRMEQSEEKQDGLAYYREQLRGLDAEIAEITGKPPDVVVGLKPGRLFGKGKIDKVGG